MTRRVVLFTDSPVFGGSEQVLRILLAGLDRRAWTPVLAHPSAPGLQPLLRQADRLSVETWSVPRMQGRAGALAVPGFVRRLRALGPAVFHAHLTQPLGCTLPRLGAIAAGIPAIVATEHLFVEVPWPLSVRVEHVIAQGMGRYLAVSQHVADQLRRALPFAAPKLQVVHNGIPLTPFEAPARVAGEGWAAGGRPVVLTIARLHGQKGHAYLLEAAAALPEAVFVLAGDGPERGALEEQARCLGVADRVVFLGHRQDIPALLAQCDLFVLPSLFEGLPLSVLEAMAAGKPVVATDVGGTREAVSHGETGCLVPPGDPHALVVAIRSLLADPGRAQAMGRAARARARAEFSAEVMVRRVSHVYEELLQGKRTVYA